MTQPRSTIYLIDDDPSVRRAMSRLIRSAGHRVETFESARSFLENTPQVDGSSCLVLDVQMPGQSGLELQHELRLAHEHVPIIFITGHGDVPTSVKAMKDGAIDFLTKPVNDVDLLAAIEVALERAAAQAAEANEQRLLEERYQLLTPREREVMWLVAQGLLNKQVALELGTVEKTIKVHRARVMEKMACPTFADLVRVAERLRQSI